MANLVTVGRLILLFIVIGLIYSGNVTVIAWSMLFIAIVFASDGLDGWIARRRGATSAFGAIFDIAGDRIVENALWIVFAHLRLIPVWVPLLVMTRGFLVDGLRSLSYAEGMSAFGERNMMRSPLTRWLTAGRFMRGLFGYVKAGGCVFLVGLEAYEHHDTTGTMLGDVYAFDPWRWFGWLMVWSAVALTVIRGVPVIVDAIALWGGRPNELAPDRAPAGTAQVDRGAERTTL